MYSVNHMSTVMHNCNFDHLPCNQFCLLVAIELLKLGSGHIFFFDHLNKLLDGVPSRLEVHFVSGEDFEALVNEGHDGVDDVSGLNGRQALGHQEHVEEHHLLLVLNQILVACKKKDVA